jgi:hypothetical protein
VWGAGQRGFLLVWNWYIPGQRNGPIGVRTPRELGGIIKAGNVSRPEWDVMGSRAEGAMICHRVKA